MTNINIKELEKHYVINKDGTIYSKIRKRIVTGSVSTVGYVKLNAKYKDGRKSLAVHRIVASKYVDGRTPKRSYVNHLDGNKLNNHADNLEWCTHKENIRHAHANGLIKEDKTKRHFNVLRDKAIVILVRNGFLKKEAAMFFDMTPNRVSQIYHKYKDKY